MSADRTKAHELLAGLRDLEALLRNEKRAQFDRDLPFEELVFDRWEQARRLGFGEGTSIYHNAYVMFDVTVGANTWIGPDVMLDGSRLLRVARPAPVSTG